MKSKLLILFSAGLLCLAVAGLPGVVSAQCTCDYTRLKNTVDNANYKVVASVGSNTSVTSLSPGTVYYLRVQANGYTCAQTSGGPCGSGVYSPVGYLISLADGCKVNGHTVPPTASIDTGSNSNYTAYFYFETLTGADFQTSLYFKVGGICSPDPGNCGSYLWADQGGYTHSVFFNF